MTLILNTAIRLRIDIEKIVALEAPIKGSLAADSLIVSKILKHTFERNRIRVLSDKQIVGDKYHGYKASHFCVFSFQTAALFQISGRMVFYFELVARKLRIVIINGLENLADTVRYLRGGDYC